MTDFVDSAGDVQESNGVSRRDALKSGLTAAAAGGLAFSAPRIEGLQVKPDYGKGLSPVKKRRRVRTGPVRFKCQPGNNGKGNAYGHGRMFNGDPEGRVNYKAGAKGHRADFDRWDVKQETGSGTIEGEAMPFSFLVADNIGGECPVIFRFNDRRIGRSRVSFVGANNCRIPEHVYTQSIGSSGSATAPCMWQTPSWATDSKTLSMSMSFEDAHDDGQDYKK